MAWYDLAFKLGCPKQFLQRYTSSSEFNRWQKYLQQIALDIDLKEKLMASILAQCLRLTYVNCGMIDEANAVDEEDFLPRVSAPEKELTDAEYVEQQIQRMERSKAMWLGVGGTVVQGPTKCLAQLREASKH